tara:strand:+ start:3368 stop:3979 length:612 start_codon:yes stop_codon:yes gene_type:complete
MDIKEAIKLFIRSEKAEVEEPPVDPSYKIKVKKTEKPVKIKIEEPLRVYMKIRKTLAGEYIIFDHPLFDTVIMPNKNKIVTFTKKNISIDPYPSQDKFFDFLMRRGVIIPDSVQGGNVFGSLEAKYPINDDVDTLETLLLVVYYFMKEDIESIKSALDYSDEIEDLYTEPEDEDSTELGEVPHKEKKGGIDPGYRPYGLIYRL